jgi:AcrR family transcriptional regulator
VPRRSSEDLREVIRDFRRDQIIDVARRLFGERGTTEVSMEEIASEAGVARSTVYVYFSGREELLRSCLQRMYHQVEEAVRGTGPVEEPGERLGVIVHSLLEVVDHNRGFFRLAMAVQGSSDQAGPAVGAELATIGLHVAELLQEVVIDGQRLGVFRPLPVARATTLVGQQLFGAMSVRAGDPAPAALDQEAAEVHEFLLHALSG